MYRHYIYYSENNPVSENCIVDLWNDNFEITELSEIMRQKDDRIFAELLNRLRTKSKKESLTDNDRDILTSVLKPTECCSENVLHIFSRNKDVSEHNERVLTKMFSEITVINADYFQKTHGTEK